MHRHWPLLVIGLLGVVAVGGIWLSLGGQGDCPPTLNVAAVDESAAREVVNYRTLSEKRQTQFQRGLAEGDIEIPKSRDTWGQTPHVRYQGDVYTTAVAIC